MIELMIMLVLFWLAIVFAGWVLKVCVEVAVEAGQLIRRALVRRPHTDAHYLARYDDRGT